MNFFCLLLTGTKLLVFFQCKVGGFFFCSIIQLIYTKKDGYYNTLCIFERSKNKLTKKSP